jgi:S-adenosylmethionine-dependent methyltransferase
MIERVRGYYDKISDSEWDRLTQPLPAVEYSSTLHLIQKYFPPKGRIIDVGSGPGRYAIALTRKGYQVTLFDISGQLLERAKTEFNNSSLKAADFVQGSATDLSQFSTGYFDAGLMLGPLLHLTTQTERVRAISELKRVLAPGAVALLQYINSWGLIKTGLSDFPAWYDEPDRIVDMLKDDVFENELKGSTDWYWSIPPIALAEVEKAGLSVVSYAGAESFLGGMAVMLQNMLEKEKTRYEKVLQVAATMAELPQYRDSTDHLVVVAKNG